MVLLRIFKRKQCNGVYERHVKKEIDKEKVDEDANVNEMYKGAKLRNASIS